LACSGCVTSAEVVLVEQQSEKEVLSNLQDKGDRVFVASISPQTLASFAAKYNVTTSKAFSTITTFLTRLGVDRVLDIATARDIALVASAQEFIHRYRASQTLPILASACPGWVCYAEKTHPYTLPHISQVKSPQQIMGVYVKDVIGKELGKSPDLVYHISVMPCYDKKLEASRNDFYNDVYRTRDVDCVLTSGELERLFISEGSLDVFQHAEESMDIDHAPNPVGSPSGGYLEFILAYAAKELFQLDGVSSLGEGTGCQIKTVRNADMKEITLEVNGQVLLRFAICYGFRNIQNLVRRIKSKRCVYHYVEVMACPSGCINGGGQLHPGQGQEQQSIGAKEWLTHVANIYHSTPTRYATNNPLAQQMVQSWLGGWETDLARKALLTQYHDVKSNASQANPLATTW
ncbi:iron hydrogenase, partial [Piptocephalis cylindrospora]